MHDEASPTRTVVLTGGTTGIGRATVTELARRGFDVIFTARDPAAGDVVVAEVRAATGNDRVSHRHLDLASLTSVGEFAAALSNDLARIDVLINNAGVVMAKRQETADGFEMTFGVNHLGHFALVQELDGLLRNSGQSGGARVVIVASDAHKMARKGLDFDDLMSTRRYNSMGVYARSKLANILHARELARRLEPAGVTVNSVHPGGVRTRLGRDGDGGRLGAIVWPLIGRFMKTPEDGAKTSVWAATDESLSGATGEYFADSAIAAPNEHGRDDAAAARLWQLSEELVAP